MRAKAALNAKPLRSAPKRVIRLNSIALGATMNGTNKVTLEQAKHLATHARENEWREFAKDFLPRFVELAQAVEDLTITGERMGDLDALRGPLYAITGVTKDDGRGGGKKYRPDFKVT